MQTQAQTLLAQIRDPELWGTGYELTATEAIAIWNWTESISDTDLQAEIAGVVAVQHLSRHYDTAALTKQLKGLADEALANAHWKNYAGFLEGLSVLEKNNWEQRQKTEEVLCLLFARLADTKRQVWHVDRLAGVSIQLHAFEQAKRVLVDAYHISHMAGYYRGIGHVLLRIGLLPDAQGKPLEACRFLYHAKAIFETARSIFIL